MDRDGKINGKCNPVPLKYPSDETQMQNALPQVAILKADKKEFHWPVKDVSEWGAETDAT